MTNTQALAPRPAASAGLQAPTPRASMSERLADAKELARAGDAVPPAFKNAGAMMLAVDWAAKHDLDIFTTIQNVSFIRGKPTYSAELWMEFAERKGWKVFLAHIDERTCTAELYKAAEDHLDPEVVPAASWTSDIAKDSKSNNGNWKTYPKHMLRANAIRNLCKFHANLGALAMLEVDPDDGFVELDVVEVLQAATPTPEIVEPEPTPVVVAPAEPWDDPAATEAVDAVDVDEVKQAIKGSGLTQAAALQSAQVINADITSVRKLAEHPDVLTAVLAGA